MEIYPASRAVDLPVVRRSRFRSGHLSGVLPGSAETCQSLSALRPADGATRLLWQVPWKSTRVRRCILGVSIFVPRRPSAEVTEVRGSAQQGPSTRRAARSCRPAQAAIPRCPGSRPAAPAPLATAGFNQARELALAVRRVNGLRLLDGACTRIRDTPPLWGLSPPRRHHYLQGAFHVASDLRGVQVALIDDVLTTGATADALARCLHRSGASRVEIWTVARAVGAQGLESV